MTEQDITSVENVATEAPIVEEDAKTANGKGELAFPNVPVKAFEEMKSKSAKRFQVNLEAFRDDAYDAYKALASVRDASAAAEKYLATSDDEIAVNLREAKALIEQSEKETADKIEAARKEAEAQFAAEKAENDAARLQYKKLEDAELSARMSELVKDVNTAELSAAYSEAFDMIAGTVKTIQKTEASFSFTIPTVQVAIAGSTKSGSTDKQWMPRFSFISVNGVPIAAATDSKGNPGNPRMSDAAKVAGIGFDVMMGKHAGLEKATGGRKDSREQWANLLDSDGGFAFEVGKEGSGSFAKMYVKPAFSEK